VHCRFAVSHCSVNSLRPVQNICGY
jgi:hypothetical protein